MLGPRREKAPSFPVALNCGTGSSFLKAPVNAFETLHMVLAANSTRAPETSSARWNKRLRIKRGASKRYNRRVFATVRYLLETRDTENRHCRPARDLGDTWPSEATTGIVGCHSRWADR